MKKFLSLCLCILYIKGNAQTDLDPVTITASLTQSKISASGRDIIIVKGERFNQLPVHSLDEMLRYLPGIEVQQRGPQGAQSDILIRGGTFQQVLVILDGIRLNDPLTGHFNSYIPVATAEIERIEILKGAASAVYGCDAVGGVIHIISKTFAAKQQEKGKELIAQITAGEFGLLNVNAGAVWQNNNTAIGAGIISNNAGGQQQRGTKGFFHNTTVSSSLKHFINNNWSLAFRSAYDKRNFAAQNFYTAFTSDTAKEQVDSWWNHLNINYQKGKQQFSFSAGYKQTRDEYFFTKAVTPNLNKSKIIQSLATYSYQFNAKTALTGGAQFINRSIRSNDRGNHNVNIAGAFIIFNKQLGNNFHINPAIRTDWSETSGFEFIPQINLSYRFQQLLFRGSIGKSTRDADFTERYNNFNKTLVTSGNIGNPDLQAEQAWSYEAGADYFISNNLKLSATFFTKDYTQLIDWVNTTYAAMPRKINLSPTGNYFLASNISKLNTTGLETAIQFNKEIDKNNSLFSNVGFSFINSSSTPSLYISSHAKFLFNYAVIYRYKFLQLAATGLYKQRQPQSGNAALITLSKDYFVCNFKVDAAIIKNILSVFVQCDNAFDRNYADRFGVPMPGRWFSGGVSFHY